MTDYPLRGVYINLDRSIERQEYMQSRLKLLGLDTCYSRFSGVDGAARQLDQHFITECTAGEPGCYLSHVGVLDFPAIKKITVCRLFSRGELVRSAQVPREAGQ